MHHGAVVMAFDETDTPVPVNLAEIKVARFASKTSRSAHHGGAARSALMRAGTPTVDGRL